MCDFAEHEVVVKLFKESALKRNIFTEECQLQVIIVIIEFRFSLIIASTNKSASNKWIH